MRDAIRVWVKARPIRVVCAVVAGGLGAFTPFFYGGATVHWYTDAESRAGYAMLAVFVHALIGGVCGWALGALIDSFRRPRA